MPYLSPESLPSDICTITLQIPNDELLRLAVMGQVYALTDEYLWEQYGAITPAQAAAAMLTTYTNAQYCEPPVTLPNVAFQASKAVNQTLSDNNTVLCPMPTIENNAGGYYNNSTSRFTPLAAGRYGVWVNLNFSGAALRTWEVRKNGLMVLTGSGNTPNGTTSLAYNLTGYGEVTLDGIDDYLELFVSRFANNVVVTAGLTSVWGARLLY